MSSSPSSSSSSSGVVSDDIQTSHAVEREALHMSRFSADIASEIRKTVREGIRKDERTGLPVLDHRIAACTFVIPDTTQYSPSFREFIRKDFLQTGHLVDLTTGINPVLNWSPEFGHLNPIQTTGDGNCLLNGISICMFGVHDRDLELRSALHSALTTSSAGREQLKARWLVEHQAGSVPADFLEAEWTTVISQTSLDPVPNQFSKLRYESLEAFHIFVLANIIKRPIIVYSEPHIRDPLTGKVVVVLEDTDRIDGIYLPLLYPPETCSQNPLALTFADAHFAALVTQQSPRDGSADVLSDASTSLLPIESCIRDLFPVHYLTAAEKAEGFAFLRRWFQLSTTASGIRCCVQQAGSTLDVVKELLARYFDYAREKSKEIQVLDAQAPASGPCRGGCGFTGSSVFEGFCSQCFRRQAGLPVDSHIPELNAHLTAHLAAPEEPETAPCRAAGCQFSGTRARSYYCSQCFQTYGSSAASLPPPPPPPSSLLPALPSLPSPSVLLPSAPQLCLGNCGFHGSPQNLGYCSLCFNKYILSHISAASR